MLSRLSSFSGPLSKLFNAIKGFTLNGLILRYEISDTNSYSGSNTVTDLVSNSNATLTNGPTYSINGYINFDGANDYLLTNTSLNSKLSPANTSSVISHFIWIYPTDNGVIVSEQGNPPLNSGWHDSQIEIVAGNLKFGLWQSGGGVSSLNSSISTPFYNWYYVGLTYDGSIMRGYVNGQLAGSKSVSRWTPYNNGAGVGLNYAIAANDNTSLGDGSPAKMKLGAFHVYNKALSNQEIVTKSGIVLPSISTHETRVLVVSVADDVTEYKVGDVVAMSLGHGNPPIYMIEGEPITPVYPSTLIWIYDEKITDYR
jgi:hypothetical protein